MAASAKQGHARVDSAVNGIDSLPDTFVTARTLHTAVKSYASDEGFRTLSTLVDEIPRLTKDLKERDNAIKRLQDDLAVCKEKHSSYNEIQLEGFQRKYDKWNEETTSLQSMLETAQRMCQEKDEHILTLQERLENNEVNTKNLEEEKDSISKMLDERDLEANDLETKLDDLQAIADELREELEESQNQAALSEASLKETAERSMTSSRQIRPRQRRDSRIWYNSP